MCEPDAEEHVEMFGFDSSTSRRLEPRLVDRVPVGIALVATALRFFTSPAIHNQPQPIWFDSWRKVLDRYAIVFIWLMCHRVFWAKFALIEIGLASVVHVLWLCALGLSMYVGLELLHLVPVVPILWWSHLLVNSVLVFAARRVALLNGEANHEVLHRWFQTMDTDMQTAENQLFVGFFLPMFCHSAKACMVLLWVAFVGYLVHKLYYRQIAWYWIVMSMSVLHLYNLLYGTVSMSWDVIGMAFSLGYFQLPMHRETSFIRGRWKTMAKPRVCF